MTPTLQAASRFACHSTWQFCESQRVHMSAALPLDEPAPREADPADVRLRRIEDLGMSSFRDDRW